MDEDVMVPSTDIAGLFIRDYIILNGPSSAYDIWKAYRHMKRSMGKKGPKYESFWQNYIYPLKKLGLVYQVGTEPGKYETTKKKVILDVDHGRLTDEAWFDPKGFYTGNFKGTGVKAPPVSPGVPLEEIETIGLAKEVEEKVEKKTRKRETGKRGRKKKYTGGQRVKEFERILRELPPGERVYTPTELRVRKYEIEEQLEKHEKRLRRKGKLPKKKPGPKPGTKRKKSQEKAESKTTKSSKAKKTQKTPSTKTEKPHKSKSKKKEEKPIMTEKELMAGLSPEDREFIKKILRAR